MFRKVKAFLKDPIFPHCIPLIIVPILLVAVFYLPDNLKEQYALRDLEYVHSHCITLISSHYIHMDISHLAGNLVAFLLIYIPAILYLRFLDLQTKAEKDKLVKRTYIVHLVNFLLLPPVISECLLRYPFFRIFLRLFGDCKRVFGLPLRPFLGYETSFFEFEGWD
jgi:hypothetical protein